MITLPMMISAIDNDDDRAFITHIYLKYRKLMYAIAFSFVHDPYIAEDIVASGITEMIEGINTLRKISSCRMRSYVASIIRNDSIDYVRKRDRQGKYSFLTDDESILNNITIEETVDDHILRTVEIEVLRKSIARLHLRERTLLLMKYVDERTDKEIADTIRIGQNSVRVYLSRARKHLLQIIEEVDENG